MPLGSKPDVFTVISHALETDQPREYCSRHMGEQGLRLFDYYIATQNKESAGAEAETECTENEIIGGTTDL